MPNVPKIILRWAKAATFCLLLGFVLYTLRQQQVRWADLRQPLQQARWQSGWPWVLLLLLPLNWSLEALKWQWLTRRLVALPFREALRGVLAGLSLSLALPLGDAAGRVLSLRTASRNETVGAALVAGGMQLYVALVAGTVAWSAYLHALPRRATPFAYTLLLGLAGLVMLGVVLNFYRARLVDWAGQWPRLRSSLPYWRVIGQYSHTDLAVLAVLAGLRHLTFSLQFYAAFRLFGIVLPGSLLFTGINVVFLVKTIAPAFNWLSDLGVREAAALWVFTPFGSEAPPLLAATLTLWLVNIGLPTLVGLGAVGRMRLSNTPATTSP